jgi:hypothetical protein
MIYDLESEKFITTIKGAHAVISYDGIIVLVANNMQNRYHNNDKL